MRQTVNGVEVDLAPGSLLFLGPDDEHGGTVDRDGGMIMVNVAFAQESGSPLAAHHGASWPWSETDGPRWRRLEARAQERLRSWTVDLAQPGVRSLDLQVFLADLVRMVSRPPAQDPCHGLPGWLQDGLEALLDPTHADAGTAGLARLCGRSQAHINRIIRSVQGRRTTDLINEMRLDRAACELRLGDQPITRIALAAGFGNLAYFYRLFARRFGTTPRQVRMASRRGLGSP